MARIGCWGNGSVGPANRSVAPAGRTVAAAVREENERRFDPSGIRQRLLGRRQA